MTSNLPKVHIVATGGSIAGQGPDRLDYILYPEVGGHLSIEESLARIPEVKTIAEVEAEDLAGPATIVDQRVEGVEKAKPAGGRSQPVKRV